MHRSPKIIQTFISCAFALVLFVTLAGTAQAEQNVATAQGTCGAVDLASTTASLANEAFGCFAKAFARCDFASLTATSGGGTSYAFVTYTGDRGCNVSETISRSSGSDAGVESFICNGVAQEDNALHFTGCGSQRDLYLRPESS